MKKCRKIVPEGFKPMTSLFRCSENLQHHQETNPRLLRLDFFHWDVLNLPLRDNSVDVFITDLVWTFYRSMTLANFWVLGYKPKLVVPYTGPELNMLPWHEVNWIRLGTPENVKKRRLYWRRRGDITSLPKFSGSARGWWHHNSTLLGPG